MKIHITAVPRTRAAFVGTASVEIENGLFAGTIIAGFKIWERQIKTPTTFDQYAVTFPARHYKVNGETRSFALLRPNEQGADSELRSKIIKAYLEEIKDEVR